MKAVGIRELKNSLSAYLRMVRRGEELLVTDRGTVVAEIRPPGQAHADVPYPALLEAARDGRARMGPPNKGDLYPALEPLVDAGVSGRLLDEERGGR
ncbi:MAG: type II toxin-antitoxin system prevent-host-death family antitoxin [Gemmatimonadota bacterium]